MTRAEAESFLALTDRSRTAALKKLTPRERADALLALVLALASPAEQERLVA